ncbi:unnamed protein product, partial [Enterobius vermicularis]|uniref:IgGFc_binding domain-containing protein n=1 Tax=Enterobius vermicularis TaxID=51028 RepID=A0A0N4UTG1_ENTVE
ASAGARRTTPKPTFVDGSGTEFLLVFPWNNAPFGSKQDIYLDLINLDEFSSAHVNITYYTLNENNTSEKNEDYIAVPSTNARTYFLPKNCVCQKRSYLTSMTQVPSTKINLVSDIPISVVGHNYYNGTGDSFGGARFIFISSLVAVTFKGDLAADVAVLTIEPKETVIFAYGSEPFAIVAAVRNLPAVGGQNGTDFGNPLQGIFTTDLTFANRFLFTPRSGSQQTMDIKAQGELTTRWLSFQAGPDTLEKFDRSEFGNMINFHRGLGNVVRYGNCYGDTDLLNDGAFLDTVIPESQYITGKTGYVLHHLNNWIMIIGDEATRNTSRHDGKPIDSDSYTVFKYDKVQRYYQTIANVVQGFHWFSAEGEYMLYVCSAGNGFAASYTPRIQGICTASRSCKINLTLLKALFLSTNQLN